MAKYELFKNVTTSVSYLVLLSCSLDDKKTMAYGKVIKASPGAPAVSVVIALLIMDFLFPYLKCVLLFGFCPMWADICE